MITKLIDFILNPISEQHSKSERAPPDHDGFAGVNSIHPYGNSMVGLWKWSNLEKAISITKINPILFRKVHHIGISNIIPKIKSFWSRKYNSIVKINCFFILHSPFVLWNLHRWSNQFSVLWGFYIVLLFFAY